MESRVRASPEQLSTLLEYMETHGDLARPLAGSQGRVRSDRLWGELTNTLNAVGGGVSKTTDKWKKVWADWKSKTKKKALTIRHHARGTGGGPASRLTLSASEDRVLAVMGALAVEGQGSVEELSFNRPQFSAQDHPVAQDDTVYLEIVDETPLHSTSQPSNNWLVLTPSSVQGRQDVAPAPAAPSPPAPAAPSPPAPAAPSPPAPAAPSPPAPAAPSPPAPAAPSPPAPAAPSPPAPAAPSPPAPAAPSPPAPAAPTTPRRRRPPAPRASAIFPSARRRPRLRSPATPQSAASPDRPRLRARRRRAPTPFERAASEFTAVELRRLELEEVRARLQHERDLRALEVEHERNQVFSALVNVAQAWLDYHRSRDNTEPLNTE